MSASQALSLTDVADRLHILRNDLGSALGLLPGDMLGAERVNRALDVVDDLLRDLRADEPRGES
jgi:hypothetical protein